MSKSKQDIVLEELLKKASEIFVQKQYVAQAEFYEPWLESGFTVEEVADALEDAFDELNKKLDVVPGKMN